ncbi:MAG: hypothetical protein V1804_03895 [Patescibacteria group bacterium]
MRTKILAIMAILTLVLVSFTAQAEIKVPQVDSNTSVAGQSAQPAQITEEGIAKAVQKKVGSVYGLEKKLLGSKDGKVEGAFNALDKKIKVAVEGANAAALEVHKSAMKSVDKLADAVIKNTEANRVNASNIDWLYERLGNVSDMIVKNFRIMAAILIFGFLGLGAYILYNRRQDERRRQDGERRQQATNRNLGEIQTAITGLGEQIAQNHAETIYTVNTLPSKTAEEVKRLKPLTVRVSYNGRTAIVRPRIIDGYYITTYVPSEGIAEVPFPSEIERKHTDNFTKAYNDCRTTAMKFLMGEYEGKADLHSRQQQALFSHLAGGHDAEVQIIG